MKLNPTKKKFLLGPREPCMLWLVKLVGRILLHGLLIFKVVIQFHGPSQNLTTAVLSHGRQPEAYVLAFSTFLCPTNELQSSHFSIYNFIFSTKREKYETKRRKLRLPADVRGSKTSVLKRKKPVYLQICKEHLGCPRRWWHFQILFFS